VTVHLDTRMNVTQRILQLRPAVLDAPPRTIVAGDFNTNPYVWAEGAIPNVPAQTVAATDQGPILDDYMRAIDFDTPTAGVGDTQHVAGLGFRLDAIYTRALQVGTPHVAHDVGGSDHWPLWIDVATAP
jgi:endonuclease/exonuclease/phosphatase family metal-dependent hydrolase